MPRYAEIPRVAMQVSRDVVVASIQVDLDEAVLARFQEDLLGRIHDTGSRAVILDVSGLETLDAYEFASLRRILTAVAIMGTESVLVGLQPGVVSALIEMDADVEGLRTAIDLDAAFALLEPEPDSETGPSPEPGLEDEAEEDAVAETSDESEEFANLEPDRLFGEEF